VASVVNDINGTENPSDSYPVGETVVTFIATDVNGNTASCNFTVTVIDSLILVDCNPDIVQNNDAGLCQAFVPVPPPSITSCSEELVSITNNINVGNDASAIYPTGITTVIWTINSDFSDFQTCIQNIEIVDTEAPVVFCQDYVLTLDSSGSTSIDFSDVIAGSSDNCEIESIELDQTIFTSDDLGENTIFVTVTDAAGNSSSCSSTVQVIVLIPPVAICNNINLILNESGEVILNPDDINGGSISSNGDLSFVLSPEVFSCDDIGVNQVALLVTDEIGLSNTCIAEVTLLDTLAPTLNCNNTSMSKHDYWDATYAINAIVDDASDNCFISNYSMIRNSEGNNITPNSTITLVASDASGNKSTCEVNVTIIDQECNTQFTVYPNPTSGVFYLTNKGIEGDYQIEFINDLGKLISSDTYELTEGEKMTINPYWLKSGIYAIKLTHVNKQCFYITKIVIQK